MSDSPEILKSILSILDKLNNAQDCDRILDDIINEFVKTLHFKTCAVVELNPKTEFLEIRKCYNLPWKFCKNYRKTIDSPLLKEIIWGGQHFSIPDRQYDLRVVEQLSMEHEFTSSYVAPLISQQQPLGFLYIDSDELNYFNEQRKDIVHIFAKIISACMFRDRLSEKLKRSERLNDDSGALSYESCLPHLKENFHRSMRMNEPYSFLLIDLEQFDRIIIQYGLEEAENVLKGIVNMVKTHLRKDDEMYRFGADEFLVSLPAVNRDNAKEIAEEISGLFQEEKFGDHHLAVNVYIGIATYPQNAPSLNGLLTASKNALQLAKKMDNKPRIATIETVYE